MSMAKKRLEDVASSNGPKSAEPAVKDVISVDLGVTRYFGSTDLDAAGLVSGWATPEEAHNWNDGCVAVLRMTIHDPGEACVVEFEGQPFLSQACPRQEIMLHANGFCVGYWRLTEGGPRTLSARVEREQLFERNGVLHLNCTWSFPYSTRPSEKGASNDTRELAFCFRSFMVSRAQ
jgi:hypothetical protein